MNIYVIVDAEGLCGINKGQQVEPGDVYYPEMCRYMAMEINACVAGLKEGGADKVFVHDTHGGITNARLENLTDEATGYVCSPGGYKRFESIEECDGLVLLGYHAMAGTPNAVLEHTFSAERWQNFWINGKKAGELAFDAAVAGSYGVPVIMASGDDALCREAVATLGREVVTCEVKKGLWTFGAVHLPLRVGHALVRQRAREAALKLKAGGAFKPYNVGSPVTLRLELVERGKPPIPATKPYMTRIDARTYEVVGDTPEEAFLRLEDWG